jgi:oligopeptide transport system substrate-binding protein
MKKSLFLGILILGVSLLLPLGLFAGGGNQRPAATGPQSQEYNTVYSAELASLNYLVSSTVSEMQIGLNIVSGLVEHDNFGVLRPSAAESWTISPDGLVYTFNLRQGVNWYTWDKQVFAPVVAQDFVDAMQYVLDPATASFSAHHIRGTIKNADAYFLSRSNADIPDMPFSQVGIRAVSRYVVEYTLENPTPWFLSMLTHTVYRPVNGQFLRQAGDRFGTDHRTLLSNGPFILTRHEPQNIRELERNENYWDRRNVHIPRLTFQFNREAGTLAPELFFRGEITSAAIPISIIDGWLEDPQRRDLVFPNPVSSWNFFFSFNFDPQFAPEFQPENWRRAVMNQNFRKALFHGLDRVAAHMTVDPFNPDRQLKNTMTSPGFVSVQGVDYTMLPPLAPFTSMDLFQPDQARQFAARARQELAGQVTFPVIVKIPFSTGSADATQRVQVIEQQLENLLGRDFIDIRPVGYPPTGFLDNTRRNGNFAFAEVNWGATYLDPFAYTPPFHTGNPMSYTDISLAVGSAYMDLLDRANDEKIDLDRRFMLLAEAEAFLLENALVIPYRGGGGGYGASNIQPFTIPYSAAGLSNLGFKYAIIRDRPFTNQEFFDLQARWETERLAALRAAGQ